MWLGIAAGLPKLLRRALMSREAAAADIGRSPDRTILVHEILPRVAREGGVILFVGVRAYTRDYPALLEQAGAECWTMDLDPKAAPHGAPGRHLTGDVREADRLFSGRRFDAVVCNGLFGYGLNNRGRQAEALQALAAVLKPGGRLVLGWNTSRAPRRTIERLAAEGFEAAPLGDLPAHVTAAGTDHVYAFLVRRADAAAPRRRAA